MRYFVDQIITAHDVPKAEATHFAICNNDNARYYVAIRNGIRKHASRRLSKNISAYSSKLDLMMTLIDKVPYDVFQAARMGRFVRLDIDRQVEKAIGRVKDEILNAEVVYWNIIVGNYVEKQKVVFQCFDDTISHPAVFLKVGGEKSDREMRRETDYLQKPIQSKNFGNPAYCFSEYLDGGSVYNIQATKEFVGDKVKPELTSDIVRIFHDISSSRPTAVENGILMAFSHGDFTPWNIKKSEGGYIVFDWEYCGMRFYGFDLIHFLWQIENKLHGRNNKEAIKIALEIAKRADEKLAGMSDELLEIKYFSTLEKQFGKIF